MTKRWPTNVSFTMMLLLLLLKEWKDSDRHCGVISATLKTFYDLEIVFCCKMVGWLVGFYGISTFLSYLRQIHSYANSQLCFKQFSLAVVQNLIVKNISISNYSIYSNSSNSAKYKYRFCLHTVKCQNSSILNKSIYWKYSFNVKNSSISNSSV